MPWLLVGFTATGTAAENKAFSLGCDEQPGSRFFWTERGFCDLPWHGAAAAKGLIIWNHGLHGTIEQWRAPVPPVFRLMQMRGWDVLAIKRHNLGEVGGDHARYRAVQRTLEEVRRQREAGYRHIVLAGQSYGGYLTLEGAEESRDVFAAVAFAPGVRALGGAGSLDPSITDRILQRVTVDRLVLVLPRDDALFGNVVRGRRANEVLARRPLSYLLVDETSSITGHGGATGGRFAVLYGTCMDEFLSSPIVPRGRFFCPPGDEDRAALELLLPGGLGSTVLSEASAGSLGVAGLVGLWRAFLDDTAILFGLVESAPGMPRALYRWAHTRVGGGTYPAIIRDGQVAVTFPNGARILVKPAAGDPTLTWTSADGARVLSAGLRKIHASP
ncbi:MAG TPA: hypothetical protein VNO23_00630 [Candidatus Binatia bacterium]|nr:hypothetical protein [Candidatus Binatia bacterium]